MKIKANGITFRCEVEGPEGAPWLILSNSLATNLTMWDQQAADFRDAFRVLRYDQRGHGQTDAPEGRYTFATLIADVIGLMDALSIPKAHWCGVSMGCATGMGLVQQHPDRFDRMVLCDNPGRSSPETARQWEERIAIAREGGMPALLDSTMKRWFPPETLNANPPHLDLIRQMILTTPVNGFIGCSAALADHDFRPLMPKVTHPVLYMSGEKDANNAAAMKEMQDELPGSQYLVLPGAGHISNMDQPELFSRTMRQFLTA